MTLVHHRAGAGEPLVLVHGIGSRLQCWDPVIGHLARTHEVIAVDLPGFGASAPDGSEPTVTGLASRLRAFFAELELERPHVAGNSMGGGIALELARRGAVRSATAVSPIGFWNASERRYCQQLLKTLRAALDALRPSLPKLVAHPALRAALFAVVFGKPWRAAPAACLGDVDALLTSASFDAALSSFSNHRAPAPDELRAIPVTIAWGTRDALLFPWQAQRARRALPWAEHRWLRGCGHIPFGDDPSQCAQALLAATTA
jgi:pimeloyl-ACP methyl ester carboxylesterase